MSATRRPSGTRRSAIADLLYRGTPLRAAREWAAEHVEALGPDEQAFLAASIEAVERELARAEEAARRSPAAAPRRGRGARRAHRRRRGRLAGRVLGARASRDDGTRSRSPPRGVALADSDPRTAIALAAEAMARTGSDPVDARAALVDAGEAARDAVRAGGARRQVGDASTIAVSPDGSLIVTGNRDGSISTWSSDGASASRRACPAHDEGDRGDGLHARRPVVGLGRRRRCGVPLDLRTADIPAPTELGTTAESPCGASRSSPDGKTAASASEDGTIDLWDLESQQRMRRRLTELGFDTITASFSPDGELLLIGNGLGEVTGLSVDDDASIAIPTFQAHGSDVWEIEFDEDGSRFATASDDGRVRVWDIATGDLVAEPFERSAFDVRGALMVGGDVVAGDEQGRLLVGADRRLGSSDRVRSRHARRSSTAAWGGGTLATLGVDQRLQLWSPGEEPTAHDDRRARRWRLRARRESRRHPRGGRRRRGERPRLLERDRRAWSLGHSGLHGGEVWGLAFSEDGSRIASSAEDGSGLGDRRRDRATHRRHRPVAARPSPR